MRATVKAAGKLAEALAFVTKVTPKRTRIPILTHTQLVVEDGCLTLTATDLDTMHKAQLELVDGEPGVAVVPATRLANLVAELPVGEEVALKLGDDRVQIKSGRGHWRLPTLPSLDFPSPLVLGDGAARFTLPAKTAQMLVCRLSYAICGEETRYYLNGINLRRHAGKTVCAATNGHVLAECTLDIDPGHDLNVIIPARMIETLRTIAGIGDADVLVGGGKIGFACGPWLAVSKLIDGTFPDYTRVIPQISGNRAEIESAKLLAAVARLRSVADDTTIGLCWGDDPVLRTCLSRAEDNNEDIDADVCGAARVAASADYLIQTIEALSSPLICIDHGKASDPIRVTAVNDPSTGLALIMPMTWLKLSAGQDKKEENH